MFYESLLDSIISDGVADGESKQKDFLVDIGAISFMVPDCKNLTTPLGYCYKIEEVQF